MEKSKKTQKNIDFAFIKQDLSDNKLASHLKLKSECLINSKFYMNFTKRELQTLAESYGCKVSQRKSKDEIGSILSQKIQQCSTIPNPTILNASVQTSILTSEHTGDEASTSTINCPQTSESTTSEPHAREDMSLCVDEPSTSKDAFISEPIYEEASLLNQQSASDTFGTLECCDESATTRPGIKSSKTKSNCRKKGPHKKSRKRRTTKDLTDEKDLCGVCSKSEKEGEEWICCDVCTVWYHRDCVGLDDDDWMMFSDAASLYTCPMCI
jgi:hypothetical protein